MEKLAAYNGIENPNEIQIGWTLKLPPEDYEIPSPPAVSDVRTNRHNNGGNICEIGGVGPADEESVGDETLEPDLNGSDQTNESQFIEAPTE